MVKLFRNRCTRKGTPTVKVMTASKKLRAKLSEMKKWLYENRTMMRFGYDVMQSFEYISKIAELILLHKKTKKSNDDWKCPECEEIYHTINMMLICQMSNRRSNFDNTV